MASLTSPVTLLSAVVATGASRLFKLMRVNLHFYKLQALQRLLLLYRAVLMVLPMQPLAQH